jgi:hypothetical protein
VSALTTLLREIVETCRELGLKCRVTHVVTWIAAEMILSLDFTEEQLMKIATRAESDVVFDAAVLKLFNGKTLPNGRAAARLLRKARSLERRLGRLRA